MYKSDLNQKFVWKSKSFEQKSSPKQYYKPKNSIVLFGKNCSEITVLALCLKKMKTCGTWHVTRDTWHLTRDTWHVRPDTWHLTRDTWHLTPDTWHVIPDTWHQTRDTWHVTPDMWHLTHDTWHVTPDTWHLTGATWHLTRDTWHLTCDTWWGVKILSKFQLPSSYGLGLTVPWIYKTKVICADLLDFILI